MATTDAQRQEAEQLAEEATRLHALGAGTDAIVALRRAMLLYAEVERQAREREQASPLRRGVRAGTCERYGDYLAETEEHAEAANAYQEAVDLYGQEGGEEAARRAQTCAHKALASIAALRTRPHDRLYLLIAHHERQQQQLALRAGTEEKQGDCCLHIAQIFLRRDRPQEAVARFQAALALYALAPQEPSVALSSAECHHRIAGLMANALLDLAGAARHYRAAVALYTAHELPVHGVQQERALCLHALDWIERRLENRPRETTLE